MTFKFRAISYDGQTVHGALIHFQDKTYIFAGGNFIRVNPDTVQLYIGTDKNNRNIFSDDELIDKKGIKFHAGDMPVKKLGYAFTWLTLDSKPTEEP